MNATTLAPAALVLLRAPLFAEAPPTPPGPGAAPHASDTGWYFFLGGAVLLLLAAVGIFLIARRSEPKQH
jgi:hypothetical protein